MAVSSRDSVSRAEAGGGRSGSMSFGFVLGGRRDCRSSGFLFGDRSSSGSGGKRNIVYKPVLALIVLLNKSWMIVSKCIIPIQLVPLNHVLQIHGVPWFGWAARWQCRNNVLFEVLLLLIFLLILVWCNSFLILWCCFFYIKCKLPDMMAIGANMNTDGQSFPLDQSPLDCFFLQKHCVDWVCSLGCFVLRHVLQRHHEIFTSPLLGCIQFHQIDHPRSNRDGLVVCWLPSLFNSLSRFLQLGVINHNGILVCLYSSKLFRSSATQQPRNVFFGKFERESMFDFVC
jgi:hypothetical protein